MICGGRASYSRIETNHDGRACHGGIEIIRDDGTSIFFAPVLSPIEIVLAGSCPRKYTDLPSLIDAACRNPSPLRFRVEKQQAPLRAASLGIESAACRRPRTTAESEPDAACRALPCSLIFPDLKRNLPWEAPASRIGSSRLRPAQQRSRQRYLPGCFSRNRRFRQ
jgi:hypothetical protein